MPRFAAGAGSQSRDAVRLIAVAALVVVAVAAWGPWSTAAAGQQDGAEPRFVQDLPAAPAAAPADVEWSAPRIALRGFELDVEVSLRPTAPGPIAVRLRGADGVALTEIWRVPPGQTVSVPLVLESTGSTRLVLETAAAEIVSERSVRVIPPWWSLLPPLMAIGAAILLRQVMVALFLGLWLGAMFLNDFNPLAAALRTLDFFVLNTLTDRNNANVLLFILLLGGMVGIIVRNGGTHGVIAKVVGLASTPRSGQITTWGMGLLIFFDDYTNTLVVGNTMRPITDRLRISREKLAYLVDCTAAPVASVAAISSWIGVEVGYIAGALQAEGIDRSAYLLFLESIPYRFYPLLTLAFALLIAWTGRDFGPMRAAEERARTEGKLLADDAVPLTDVDAASASPEPGVPLRWYNAAVPIVVVVAVTLIGLWWNGTATLQAQGGDALASAELYEILSAANPNIAILWGSFLGVVIAIAMSWGQRILDLHTAMSAFVDGAKSVLMAVGILVLAWSLKDVCSEVHTADYLVEAVSGNLTAQFLPVLVFLISAGVSFATGTSYGTMGILMPLVVPVSVRLAEIGAFDAAASDLLLVGSVSSVLAGSVWGDHCSPISDTTILSSMASGSDHIDHVRTQVPYAVTVGVVGMLLGDIPSAFGLSPWLCYLVAIPALWAVIRFVGRPVAAPAASPTT